MRATSFIGSSRERTVRVHQWSRNWPAQYGDTAPQRLKVLLEQVGANRSQVATHQLRKPAPLLGR